MSTSWIPPAATGAGGLGMADWAIRKQPIKIKPAFVEKDDFNVGDRSVSDVPLPSSYPPMPAEQAGPSREQPDVKAESESTVVAEPELDCALATEVDHQLALLASALSEVAEISARDLSRIGDVAVELGLAVAGELAAGAVKLEPERVLSIVSEALELLSDEPEVRVRFHPEIFQQLEDAGLLEELRTDSRIDVRKDSSIKDVGCVAETDERRVDGRVRSRLERIQHLMMREETGEL